MADLCITEFANGVSMIGTTQAQMPAQPAITSQHVAIAGASAASAAFNAATTVVEVVADTACHILFGDAPVALATSQSLPANVPRLYAVRPGQKVAVIT